MPCHATLLKSPSQTDRLYYTRLAGSAAKKGTYIQHDRHNIKQSTHTGAAVRLLERSERPAALS